MRIFWLLHKGGREDRAVVIASTSTSAQQAAYEHTRDMSWLYTTVIYVGDAIQNAENSLPRVLAMEIHNEPN